MPRHRLLHRLPLRFRRLRCTTTKIALLAVGTIIYALGFGFAYPHTGDATGALSFLLILAAAWGGLRSGVASALLNGLLINPILYYHHSTAGLSLAEHLPFQVLPALAGMALALVVGKMRDLSGQLRLELAERKRAEVALGRSEWRYRTVLERVRDVVFQADAAGRWTFLSPSWQRLMHCPPEESLGQRIEASIHANDCDQHQARMEALAEGHAQDVQYNVRMVTASSDVRWVRVRIEWQPGTEDRSGRFTGTLSDITDSIAVRAEREARRRAEELLRLKTSFVNNMSHELRTPLAGIIGFADLLAEELEEPHREMVGHIAQSGQRLMQTLSDVLMIARLDAGETTTEPARCDVAREVRAVAAPFQERAAEKHLTLDLVLPVEPLDVRTDTSHFRHIAGNLISNAVKFTASGRISVEAEVQGASLCLRVSDTGPGIPEEALPHLFEPFRQGSEGLSRSHEGSGLGLAVTQKLVASLGGTVRVESQIGEGSTFTVTLPTHASADTQPVAEGQESRARAGDRAVRGRRAEQRRRQEAAGL